MTIMLIITVLLCLFVVLYGIKIICYTIGWIKLPKTSIIEKDFPFVSIIIPTRNEANNIEKLLDAICKQDYSKERFEIIIANDHSEDETEIIVSDFIKNHSDFDINLLKVNGVGKKSALSESVHLTKYNLIITSDADSIPVSNQWIKSIVSAFDDHIQMVSAPVVFFKKRGLFQMMQSLEFLTLIASAAGAIGINKPFMCNGANIAFRKNAFENSNGFENDHFTSGDDVFLLERVIKLFGRKSIRFVKLKTAIIESESMPNLSSFLKQRIRWAGKSVGYKNPTAINTSFVVFLNAFSIILSFVLGFFNPFFFWLTLFFIGFKILIDLPICIMITRFMNRCQLLSIFILLQIFYPLYICFVAIASLFIKPKWKGRTIK